MSFVEGFIWGAGVLLAVEIVAGIIMFRMSQARSHKVVPESVTELDEKRRREQIERMIYPVPVIGPKTVILSPPLGSVEDYMKYLADHRDDYRRFFAGE